MRVFNCRQLWLELHLVQITFIASCFFPNESLSQRLWIAWIILNLRPFESGNPHLRALAVVLTLVIMEETVCDHCLWWHQVVWVELMQMKFTAVLLSLFLKMRDWGSLELFLRALAWSALKRRLLGRLVIFCSWLPAAEDGFIEEILLIALKW